MPTVEAVLDDVDIQKRLRERRNGILINKMRKLKIFPQIVKRFSDGESARSVAKWLSDVKPEGEFQNLSFSSWHHYLLPLRDRVRGQIEVELEHRVEEIVGTIQREELPERPKYRSQIEAIVEKAVREKSARYIVMRAFVVQSDRVDTIREKEIEQGFLSEAGVLEVAELRKIGEAALRQEMGDRMLSSKGLYGATLVSSGNLTPESDDLAALDNFGEVDRSILRTAGEKLITMMRESASGQFKASELGTDPEPEVRETPGRH